MMMMMRNRKWLLIPLAIVIIIGNLSAGIIIANTTHFTLVGEDIMPVIELATPSKRIDTVYLMGNDKVVILLENAELVPIGSGDSMFPMVTEGHLVLVTTDYDEIKVGDFIVADNEAGRYFHQVVEVRKNGEVLITRGINNTEDDLFPVFREEVVGVAVAVFW